MLNGSHQTLTPSSNNSGPGFVSTPVAGAAGQSTSNTTSGTAAGSSRFDNLEQTLEMFVENARHLCVIVSDFAGGSSGGSGHGLTVSASTPNFGVGSSSNAGGGSSSSTSVSQAVLNQKLQTLVSGLQELDTVKHNFADVKIPMELFDQFVDTGRNPQLYTKECMERTLYKNKQVNGKIELYKKFRAHLLKELSEEFPKEAMQYRAIRESNPTSSAASASDKTSGGSGTYASNGTPTTVKQEADQGR